MAVFSLRASSLWLPLALAGFAGAQDMFLSMQSALPAEAIVETTHGSLKGNRLACGVEEYLGVPYAESPVGALRFRQSQARKAWNGVRDAMEFGPACVQGAGMGSYKNMSEDCLNLNIWTPSEDTSSKLPVFFWIHGGAFIGGSGQDYNGTRLAQQGIVVVTTNYRLAGLGFFVSPALAKEDPSYPSNGGMNGIGDQLLALKWVHQHITAMRGDPTQITIAGESSGGISVSYLLHVPEAKGLFRRAIAESGSFIVIANQSGLPKPAPEAQGVSTAWEVDLKCSPDVGTLECLRKVHVDQLLESGAWYGIRPSVDGVLLPQDPVQLPIVTKGNQVDVILGSTSQDTVCAPPFDNTGAGTQSTKPWPADCDLFSGNISKLFGISSPAVESLYNCQESHSQHDVHQLWLRLSRDVSICCPMQWLAEKILATDSGASVWMYEFAFNDAANWSGLAGHGAELGYVFDDPAVGYFPNQSWDPHLANVMSHNWGNFIVSGEPASSKVWPRYDPSVDKYQRFDAQVEIAEGYGKHCNCDFWKSFLTAAGQLEDHVTQYTAMVNMCFQ